MARQIDADYSQDFLLPPSLEEWVPANHPARFIREFVDALDLDEMGIEWAKGETRPAYSAGLLLKVWLYGYFERIRSTRKLEKACRDHIGFVWLTGMNRPDHNTLNTFFRTNKKGIRRLFRKTVEVACAAELVGFVLCAVDGTKIQARVANRSGWHKEKLTKLLDKLEEELARLEKDIHEAGGSESPSDALPDKVSEAQTLRDKVRGALDALAAAGEKHLHPADEDARVMKCSDRKANAFAYNGQAVADEKTGIVVASDLVQECNDEHQLNRMIDQAEEETGKKSGRVVADTGYANGAEMYNAQQRQRDVVASLPKTVKPNRHKPYAFGNFTYHAGRDLFICPHGGKLTRRGGRYRKEKGYQLRRYRCSERECPYRADCTKDPKGRTIEITQYHEVIQQQIKKQQDPQVRADLKKRGHIIEPVFGFIKEHLGFRRFTLSGLENAKTQWALLCATYNLHKLYKWWCSGKDHPFGLIKRFSHAPTLSCGRQLP